MKFLREFYLTSRFLLLTSVLVLLFFFGYFYNPLFIISQFLLVGFLILIVLETSILFSNKKNLFAQRVMNERLSNGDDNEIKVIVTNNYTFKILYVNICNFV